jgi:hypothetical protein
VWPVLAISDITVMNKSLEVRKLGTHVRPLYIHVHNDVKLLRRSLRAEVHEFDPVKGRFSVFLPTDLCPALESHGLDHR